MLKAPPFSMTAEAAEHVLSRLQDQEPGRKPHLIRGFGYADGFSDLVYYEGEHFQLVYEESTHAPGLHVELFGHQVAIAKETLQRLTNRVLTLHGIPLLRGDTKYVLLSP
jgi:hypothetical protein